MLQQLVRGSKTAIFGFVEQQSPEDLPALKLATTLLLRVSHGAMLSDEAEFLAFKTPESIEPVEIEDFKAVLGSAFAQDYEKVKESLALLSLSQKFSFYSIAYEMNKSVTAELLE